MSPDFDPWYDGPYDDGLTVCVTHKRFVPCRKNDGCVISTDQKDIDDVQAYQNSG